MKIQILLTALLMASPLMAEETDTLRTVQMDEVVVVATPKETRALRELPIASHRLTQSQMRAKQVTGIKSLTSLVPNLFIPDYGSRLTTAVYIRGIGSRINTPAVGLYVDNIPYIDKSAFDFNYADIEQIEVLRGPQSLLYGRNTMGGLIKVQTKSPFTYQGTDIRLGAATYGDYNASLTSLPPHLQPLCLLCRRLLRARGRLLQEQLQGRRTHGPQRCRRWTLACPLPAQGQPEDRREH